MQSIGLSPNGSQVLAVITGLSFPGDVMATIDPSTESITATVSLQTGTNSMGQLVSDGTLDYVWVTDETNGTDTIQNLNLAVSDPASQPYVTTVGGTSLGHGAAQSFGPPPTETTWNDALYYSEGAGGGGISETFAMPDYQQPLGVVSGSSGTPCANTGGDCREVPDVSADADPSSGYIVYDTVDGFGGWNALGGTSGATPLWAAVLAVVASADGNTAGYGALNPALYLLAQRSPSTYLNDVTSGNNDYNATADGQYPATAGYDMATGLGTPVASELASGLTTIPLTVVVSGTQAYGGAPTFSATANYAGSGTTPYDVTLNTSGLTCTTVGSSTAIGPSLPVGQYTVLASSCSGLTFSGADGSDYSPVYTSTANDFTVTTGPIDVAVSGSQIYGGTPTFGGTDSPPPGVTVSTSGVNCTQVGTTTITTSLPAGSYALATSSCGGATLSGANESDYTIAYTSAAGDFAVTKAPLTVTASSTSMTYGGTVPTITAAYSGFTNGDSAASLTTRPTCTTTATSASPVLGSPYATSCGGAVDPNYAFSYFGGSVTVNTAPLTITAASPTMTYGGTVPTISPLYTGFKNGDAGSSMSTPPSCSTTATSSSTVAGSPYQTFCSGAADSNYTITYATGALSVGKAQLMVTAMSTTVTYGGTVPTITPSYSGFVNGDSSSSLTTQPTCSTTATSTSTVAGSPYPSSCTGAVDPNYTVVSVNGSVTVAKAPLTITASNGTMPYNGTVPAIMPGYSGFVNGDSASSLTTNPTCATTANGSSSVSGSPYSGVMLGSGGQQLRHHLCRGVGDGHPCPSDDHRLEHLHDLRSTEAGDHARLHRFRQRRLLLVADDKADVHNGGHKLECGVGDPLRVVVRWGGRHELHHRVRERVGHGQHGPADDHAGSLDHGLWRHGADDHTRLLGIRQRRLGLVAHDGADVLDERHQLRPAFAAHLPIFMLGSVRLELHHRLRPRGDHGDPGIHSSGRQRKPSERGSAELRRRDHAAAAFGRDGRYDRCDLQPGPALDEHQWRLVVRQLHVADRVLQRSRSEWGQRQRLHADLHQCHG